MIALSALSGFSSVTIPAHYQQNPFTEVDCSITQDGYAEQLVSIEGLLVQGSDQAGANSELMVDIDENKLVLTSPIGRFLEFSETNQLD